MTDDALGGALSRNATSVPGCFIAGEDMTNHRAKFTTNTVTESDVVITLRKPLYCDFNTFKRLTDLWKYFNFWLQVLASRSV